VRVEPRRLLDGTRDAGDLVLDGAVGVALEGDAIAAARDRAALLTAADALGAAGRMLDLAVEYAGQRKQFGVPIGSFQAVKHAAAEMLVAVEAARSIVYDAAIRLEHAQPEASVHAAVAKAQVTAAAARAADSALTLHGAIGYTYEHDLQLFYKRAKLDQALFGAPEAWNERIADALRLVL
jgi:alkylation response protein AidB-like acyl-CoA dehydrogenase